MKKKKFNSTASNFNNTMQSFVSSKQSPKLANEKSSLTGMLGNFRDARDSYTSMIPSKVSKEKINPFKVRDGSTGNQSSLPDQRHNQDDRSTIF